MKSIENLIADNEGNHLMVALDFYDEDYKLNVLQIPTEFGDMEVVDINIAKRDLEMPLHYRAFGHMSQWLVEQFMLHGDAVFTFICSIDPLDSRHGNLAPEKYRWNLFDSLYRRACSLNPGLHDVLIQDIVIGPDGYQSFGRVFFRDRHAPIIHIVIDHLKEKQDLYYE